jgi:hypothetical protein
VFNDKLKEWEDYYNDNRPHGGLDGQAPRDFYNEPRPSPAPTNVSGTARCLEGVTSLPSTQDVS